MKPIGDKILVKPIKADNVSKGGIILTKEEPVNKAEVVDPGEYPEFKAGDVILIAPNSGHTVFLDETEHKILKYSDVWAIL